MKRYTAKPAAKACYIAEKYFPDLEIFYQIK